jgi:hypothetical protein
MDGSYSQFRAMAQRRAERKESKNRRINNTTLNTNRKEFVFSKMSKDELSLFKKKLEKKSQSRKTIQYVLVFIMLVLVAIIVFLTS